MNVPTELFVALLSLAVSGQTAVIWFLVRKLAVVDSRLARMEMAMEMRWRIKLQKHDL